MPLPCLPITLSLPELSAPTLAFRSPMMMVRSCNGTCSISVWTLFPHREIHKITWCSPNGRDRNQIDHLLINGKWRRSLRDVKVRRGADIGSDHHLVTACLKLKLKSAGRLTKGHSRFDVSQLKHPNVLNLLSWRCATDSRLLWN